MYSAGCQLVAAGPKEDILSFTKEFHLRFAKWTAFSKNYTLSASISDNINDIGCDFKNKIKIGDNLIN